MDIFRGFFPFTKSTKIRPVTFITLPHPPPPSTLNGHIISNLNHLDATPDGDGEGDEDEQHGEEGEDPAEEPVPLIPAVRGLTLIEK